MSSLTLVVAGLGLLLVFVVWRAGRRRAKADAVRSSSLAGRVLFTAGLTVGVQWLVITQVGTGWLLLAVLSVPALFASYTVTRALTMQDVPRGRR